MADADIAKRREIRKRKILEYSESRLNRITSSKKNQDIDKKPERDKCDSLFEGTEKDEQEAAGSRVFSHQEEPRNLNGNDITSKTAENSHNFMLGTAPASFSGATEEEIFCSASSNGAVQRSSTTDNYIFPKKVSDAETRSYVRSRCDARRNSTCTQMMMETLQFSSFSLAVFRPWIAAMLSFALKVYFLFTKKVPFFQTLLFPYFMMEVAFFTWTKFESQVNSKQNMSTLISGVLVLCGVPLHIVSGFNSAVYLVQSAMQDLAVYIFSFVFLHFIFGTYV